MLLADPVEAADALLEQVRVGRQVEQHQVVGELEVAAFGADFRTDQHLGAEFLVGEVRRGAVALKDAHAFVEHGGGDAGAHAQGVFQVQGGFRVGADHQHLELLEHLQGVDQPLDARVEAPPALGLVAAVALVLEADFRVEVRILADGQLHVLHRVGQRVGVQLAFGEAAHGGAGVAEQDAAGAVAVEQLAHQARRGFGIAGGQVPQQAFAFLAEEALDGLFGLGAQAALVQQFLHGFGHRAVVGAFGAEGFQIVEAARVQQAQAREVAFLAELFRGGGEQQDAGDDFGQLLHQAVLGAGLVRVPDQVVGFVHHQQVPAGGEGRVLGALAVLQPFQGHQGQLAVLEGIAGVAFGETLGVEQGHLQVEAAAHFHQPLVLEVFRHQDQHPAGAAGDQLAVDHQAGFDGLAQAHFVGQQYARRNAVGHFTGDVQLVGNGLGAGAAQAPEGGLQQARAVLQAVVTQGEPVQRVDLAGEQAVAGQAELDEVVQLGFRQGTRLVLRGDAVVDQQAVDVLDFLDIELPAVEVGDLVARGEPNAGQGCIAQRVLAGLASGRVEHGEQAAIRCQDGSEPQLRFAVTDPALPRFILLRHACLPVVKKAGYVNGTQCAGRRRMRAVCPQKCSERL
ncbi:hypothetical protein D3C78_577840 [compost metagenome]